MNIKESVQAVASKFVYEADTDKFVDSWEIMQENQEGKMLGDCDEFSLTAIWYACDQNWVKFILNVFILHRYRFYFCKSSNGNHVIGYAQGLYFDNWTKEALPKQEFLDKTKHEILFPYISPWIMMYMLKAKFF
jgi:hypothetical protein